MPVLAAFRYEEPRRIWGAGMLIRSRREMLNLNGRGPSSHLQFLLDGELVVERYGQRSVLKKGGLQVLLAGEDHRHLESSDRVHTLSIAFEPLPGDGYRVVDPADLDPVNDGELRIPVSTQGRTSEALHDVFRDAHELVISRESSRLKSGRRFYDWQLQAILRQLLLTLASRLDPTAGEVGRPTSVQRVVWLLSTHVDRSYALEELADEAGVSVATLTRHFKKTMGCTIKQFQQRMRIQQARMWLMEDPGMRLSDIAERLAFHDEFHFSKTFKQHCGQSPSEYRRSF